MAREYLYIDEVKLHERLCMLQGLVAEVELHDRPCHLLLAQLTEPITVGDLMLRDAHELARKMNKALSEGD